MGVFDQNLTRLKTIIFIFIFLFVLYGIQGIFFNASGEVIEVNESELEFDNSSGTWDIASGFWSILQFITFTSPNLPWFMQSILAPISTILLIVNGYLIADIIYDAIKGAPFT